MELYIQTANVLNDFAGRWYSETSLEELPVKAQQVQALNESWASLVPLIGRWMQSDFQLFAEDTLNTRPVIHITLNLSPRRAAGKVQAVTDTIHSFLVNSILAKVYSVNAMDALSQKYTALAASDAETLSVLINTKQPPII